MPQRLFLIDGHALIFKMHYAFLQRPMINSKGSDMSILYGFTKYLLELIDRENPTHIAVAFDPPGGTFRNEMYPLYKANRPPTPQLVREALEPLTEMLQAMHIPVLMVRGFEADDVIGSMAKRSEAEGFEVYMVTPDKDYGQLVSDRILQLKPGRGGGENELYDVQRLCEKYGIQRPEQIIDILTICGDASDNVPGVKGVGEVGASRLIMQYGSVEGIYEHISELSPRQQGMFEEARDHIALSKALVTIKTDIPLGVTADEMRFDKGNFSPAIVDLFEKYEFPSLRRYIAHVAAVSPKKQNKELNINEISPDELIRMALRSKAVSLITEAAGNGIFSKIRRLILGAADGDRLCTAVCSLEEVKSLIEDPEVEKYGCNLKLQSNLLDYNGAVLNGRLFDIELMHYLINPEKSHKVEILAKSYLDIDLEESAEEGVRTGSLFEEAPGGPPESSRSKEAAVLLLLGQKIRSEMPADLYETMEEPLSKVLARMERTGVRVDLPSLEEFAEGLRKEIEARQAHIREMAGEPELNVSSPKQIGDVLFDKMQLDPKAKKNSKGSQYSTDEATLLALADRHPIIDEILEFRAAKKLLSTYIEPFPTYISPVDGRIHTTFNQALTATGRLSSSNPNLQNIPIRTDRGREIRKAFVPATPEGLILSADYSQIELRIMAHLSQDQHLIEAFRSGIDVHAATAAKIFGIPHEEVTADQRRIAKTANFGIMYGISSFGLAQRLRLPRTEAKKLIDDYFASFPAIRSFIQGSVEFAKANGYVETLFGRRRYLPDIDAKNAAVRSLAERNAVNAPIQGTAADIIKLAMIRVDGRIRGMKSRMVLQIHDELLFDAVPEETEALRKIVIEAMENVAELSVPLTVECNAGKNWIEAH